MFIANVLSFNLARIDTNIIYQLPHSSHSENAFPVLYIPSVFSATNISQCEVKV